MMALWADQALADAYGDRKRSAPGGISSDWWKQIVEDAGHVREVLCNAIAQGKLTSIPAVLNIFGVDVEHPNNPHGQSLVVLLDGRKLSVQDDRIYIIKDDGSQVHFDSSKDTTCSQLIWEMDVAINNHVLEGAAVEQPAHVVSTPSATVH
jgi:hypothetical protein